MATNSNIRVYVVRQSEIPVTAVEGLQGLYQTRFYCGHDYEMAVWYTTQKNLSMGIDTKTATEIIHNALVDTPLQSWNHLPI